MKSWIAYWIRRRSLRAESNISKDLILTSGRIREQLAETSLDKSLADIMMPPGADLWPDELKAKLNSNMTPAAVLIPIVERPTELMVLLTRRSAELKHHAGQISFPGGRSEEHDASLVETALRETHEEVGVTAEHVSVVGFLSTMPSITSYSVTPVVAMVSADAEVIIDKAEVEYTFEVPLNFLLDEGNDIRAEWTSGDRKMPMLEFVWEGERIWGLTAFMIRVLRKELLKQ
jgi:8-oxo-dGTP pyrophosphatase MutT (NUDIX family)